MNEADKREGAEADPKDQAADERKPAALRLADGRRLPDLLFATDVEKLRSNVGDGVDELLKVITGAGKFLHDVAGASDPWKGVAAAASGKAGVVLVGGHDVLPLVRQDVVPPNVRRAFAANGDPDNFVVWSDEGYVDCDGDGIPDMPVTRIPDGRSLELLKKVLTATPGTPRARRFGLRNAHRPFADDVFAPLPGVEPMRASGPAESKDLLPGEIDAERLYLMLHGAPTNGTKLWGEGPSGGLVAFDLGCVPEMRGGIVFSGCCYGALVVDDKAFSSAGGAVPSALTPSSSIALSLLEKGASAFVGCTGAHYSPAAPPYNWGSPVFHTIFWEKIARGLAPAEALFRTKIDYLASLPYVSDPDIYAILLKPSGQFTCLGLGW